MFRLIDETVSVGMQPLHLLDEFRRVVRRQQRDLSPQERSGERDGKAIAVRAQVEDVRTLRQACGKRHRIVQEARTLTGAPRR